MKFYHFRQNNSGGSFTVDENVNKHVFIQAPSAKEANEIAEDLGIYFDGVDRGIDCNCCGDRWYPTDDFDAVDKVKFDKWTLKSETIIHPIKTILADKPLQEHRRLEI